MKTEQCPACFSSSGRRLIRRLGMLSVVECSTCGLVFTDSLHRGQIEDVGSHESSVTDEDYYSNIVAHHDVQERLAIARWIGCVPSTRPGSC